MPISNASTMHVDVAIVGGGASGALTAIGILEICEDATVAIIDRSGTFGRGVAYAAGRPEQRLNVRAANMSADPDDPSGFVNWLEGRGSAGSEVGKRFLPRSTYGDYLSDLLDQAVDGHVGRLHRIRGEAVSVGPGLRLELADGSSITCDHMVLALGNLPPSIPCPLRAFAANERFIANPWKADALERIGLEDFVFIVGTGLTMVDAVLSLRKMGHRGTLVARSRHGLLPQCHRMGTPASVDIRGGDGLFSAVIAEIRRAGGEWRRTIDGLRPHTVKLWQGLSWRDRARFHEHLQTYWDVHRHRMAECVGLEISDLIESGQLDVGAGRIVGVRGDDKGFCLDVQEGASPRRYGTEWIVNCTGPGCRLAEAKLPLLEAAIAAGLISYDPLGIGLLVDDLGRSQRNERVWALGPVCRGCRLESTAIPEIRVQSRRLAKGIREARLNRRA